MSIFTRWKQPRLLAVLGVAALLTIAGAVYSSLPSTEKEGTSSGGGSSREEGARETTPALSEEEINARVAATIDRMSDEELVGQVFISDAAGTSADAASVSGPQSNRKRYQLDTPAEIVQKYYLGGFIYFGSNITSPQQLAEFSAGLQKTAQKTGAEVPLLIGIDQEGGSIMRMRDGATQVPGNAALGAARDPELTRSAARVLASELRAVGVTQNFAPDADVNNNPQNPVIGARSFSEDSALVSTLVEASIEGHHAAQVATAVKHFPGHGDTDTDSHHDLPVINSSVSEWESTHRPPFDAAIRAGTDLIMTAHMQVPALDPSGEVATLSPRILTNTLRGKMGYDGVIVTDSLRMKGVTSKYPDPAVPAVKALQAGADMLLMPPNLEVAYTAVLAALDSGELTRDRLEESVRRILTVKARRGILQRAPMEAADVSQAVGTQKNRDTVQRAADKAVTAITNPGGILPVAAGGTVVVTGWGKSTTKVLTRALSDQGAVATRMHAGEDPSRSRIGEVVATARTADTAVVTGYNLDTHPAARQLITELASSGTRVVVVGVTEPYEVAQLPSSVAYLAAYDYAPASLSAAARVVTGSLSPTGKLPFRVPDTSGQVLYPVGHAVTW